MEPSQTVKELQEEIQGLREEYDKLLEANQVLNERIIEVYTLYNVSRTLSMSLQLNELLDLVMSLIGKSLNINRFSLMLLDEQTRKLSIRAAHGLADEILFHGEFDPEAGLSGKAFSKGEPVIVEDLSKTNDFIYFQGSGLDKGSYLGVPLKRPAGTVIGVLNAHKSSSGAFKDSDLRLFKAVSEHVAVAIDHALAFQQTQELMSRDELTNLYNRRYFFERFEREVYRAERYGRRLSVLMIDIDHFKNYNDTYGHLRGDQALRRMARLLEANLRRADIIARYGGEEFLVLLPETEKDDAVKVCEKLRSEVEKIDFNDDAPRLDKAGMTITLGVASMPDDSEEAIELIDLADKALYYGKAQGRNRVCCEVPTASGK